MDKYERIGLKLNKIYEMKTEIAKDPNGSYKRYRDHRIAYAKIKETVEYHLDFIANSCIIKTHQDDMVKFIAEMHVANHCFYNDLFLHLLATCSLANRLKVACQTGYMPPEIAERIRDCMVVFCE